MAWTTPKTDWGPTTGVSDTELNKIGNNLAFLKETSDRNETALQMFGSAAVDDGITILAAGGWGIGTVLRTVPDGISLVVRRISWRLQNTNLRAKVFIVGESDYTSSTHEGDAKPGTVLYANSSGSDQDKLVTINIQNPSGGNVTLNEGSSVSISAVIDEV